MAECEVMSKTYEQIQIDPQAARVVGEMELSGKTYGFHLTALTAAMIDPLLGGVLARDVTLITEAECVKVTKAATAAWVAGDPIFWIEGSEHFTNVDDGAGYLVGKAAKDATQGAEVGYMIMHDYYPVQRGLQIGTDSIPYKITSVLPDPIMSLFASTDLTEGTIIASKIQLASTVVGVATYFKALEVTAKSNVKTGYGFWAIQGNLDFQTNGQVIGKAAAIEAGLTMPAKASVSGHYFALDAEISIPAGGSWSGYPGAMCAFARYKAEGDGVAAFRDDGYFFVYDGSGGGGSGKLLYVNTVTATLRCKMNSVDYFLQFHKVEAAS